MVNGRIDSEYGFLEQILSATSSLINDITSINDALVVPEDCILGDIKCRKIGEFIEFYCPMASFIRRIFSKENRSPSIHIVTYSYFFISRS